MFLRASSFICLLFCSSTIVAGQLTPLQSLQKSFRGKQGFEVRFIQEVEQSTFKDQRHQAEGVVKFQRPDVLDWTYEKPTKRLIQYHHSKLVITEGGERHEIKETGPLNLQESFSFLWGETNQTLYKIQNLDADRFRILPRDPKKASFRSIEVLVQQGRVAEAKIENNLEGQSILKFSGWKIF